MSRPHTLAILLITLLLPAGCQGQAPIQTYKVIAKFPHSTSNYTEGFFYKDGMFFEGTGLTGHSQLLVEKPETGQPLQHLDLPKNYFGEGIVDWGPNLYEWTWTSHICFVYDRFSLRPIKQFTYTGEGWGMTRTQKEIITSDGTSSLRFRNPETFQETHHIVVKDGSQTITQLNELEYIQRKGSNQSKARQPEIWANVWHSDRIARISPKDGQVLAWVDLTGLLPASEHINAESVLNGIAYDQTNDRIFVTGKQWPWVFQIEPTSPK